MGQPLIWSYRQIADLTTAAGLPDLAPHKDALFVRVKAEGGDIRYRLDYQDPNGATGVGLLLGDGDEIELSTIEMAGARFHAATSSPTLHCHYKMTAIM